MFRKIIAISFVILLLFTITGCIAAEDEIESEEQAQDAVIDVSEDIAEISDTLESINEDLG